MMPVLTPITPDFPPHLNSMLRTKTLRAAFLVPVAVALAMACQATSVFADTATINTLNVILNSFALQEGKTAAQAASVTTAKASADDLVYAVYEAAARLTNPTPQQLAEIAASALESVPSAPGSP